MIKCQSLHESTIAPVSHVTTKDLLTIKQKWTTPPVKQTLINNPHVYLQSKL